MARPVSDVVERLVAKLLLERLALGDVAVVDDDAADGRVVEQVLGDRLERSPGAVGVAGPELDRHLGAARGRDVGQRRGQRWRDRLGGRPRSPAGRSRSSGRRQDALDGRALVADQTVLAQDEDAVRGVLDERPEALLAALQVHQQQPLGRRLLLEPAVLAGQDARRATERKPDEADQQARRDDARR